MAIWREEVEEILVIGGELRFPDRIGRGGTAEGAIEAGKVAYLWRCQVHEYAGDAALRYVAEAGAIACAVRPAALRQVRQRSPHIAISSSSSLSCVGTLSIRFFLSFVGSFYSILSLPFVVFLLNSISPSLSLVGSFYRIIPSLFLIKGLKERKGYLGF